MTLIHCHFDGKVFVPEEPVDLPRNQRVILHVEEVASDAASETATGAWDVLTKSAGSVQAPVDWSSEHDHYLYGTPKRGDPSKQAPSEEQP